MSATIPEAQSSEFFNVLNRDVRNLIYGYMTSAGDPEPGRKDVARLRGHMPAGKARGGR
jgi:hypothetical protein